MRSQALDFFLDVLFPRFCAGCKREGLFLCEACRRGIIPGSSVCFVCEKRSPDGLICELCKGNTKIRRFIAPFAYAQPTIRELIHLLKYGGAREIADDFGNWIAASLSLSSVLIPKEALLVPIPLHSGRLRERGFNQAELIARSLAHHLGLSVNAALLKRTLHRKPQTEMKKREERLDNAKGIYKVAGDVSGKLIILVDDVSTTGATLEEAAAVFKKARAKQVWAIAVAR